MGDQSPQLANQQVTTHRVCMLSVPTRFQSQQTSRDAFLQFRTNLQKSRIKVRSRPISHHMRVQEQTWKEQLQNLSLHLRRQLLKHVSDALVSWKVGCLCGDGSHSCHRG